LRLEPGHVAQLGGAHRSEVLGVREQDAPTVAEPIVESDRSLRRFGGEIRSVVVDAQHGIASWLRYGRVCFRGRVPAPCYREIMETTACYDRRSCRNTRENRVPSSPTTASTRPVSSGISSSLRPRGSACFSYGGWVFGPASSVPSTSPVPSPGRVSPAGSWAAGCCTRARSGSSRSANGCSIVSPL